MTIEKYQYEQEWRKLDGELKKSEILFLKTHQTEIITNKKEFAENFWITDIFQKIIMWKEVNKEEVALIQAYLFHDPEKIDGIMGNDTRNAIQNSYTEKKITTKEKIIEKSYTLSEVDFKKYFWMKNFSQWTGNCYAVAVMDSLQDLDNFEQLIRNNVSRSVHWFEIRLPLDEKRNQQKSYTVLDSYLKPQIASNWEKNSMLEVDNGYSAILHAIWQIQTGKTEFDFTRIISWYSGKITNILIKNQISYNSYVFDMKKLKRNTESTLNMKLLSNFEKWKDMMVIDVYVDDHNKIVNNPKTGNHAISVEKVKKDKNGKVTWLIISNPRYAGTEEELLLSQISWVYLSTWKYIELNKNLLGNKDIWVRWIEKNPWYAKIEKNRKSSLTTIIEWTKNTDVKIRWERWDVIVTKWADNIINIQSRSKKDTNIVYNEYFFEKEIIIKWWDKYFFEKYWKNLNQEDKDCKNRLIEDDIKQIQCVNTVISKPYIIIWNKTLSIWSNTQQDILINLPRISVFINKMRHDYMDIKKWDPNNIAPFSLWKSGEILFDDDPSKFSSIEYAQRIAKELLPIGYWYDDSINCLNDRSLLGIQATDTPTKQKIVDFLNKLYVSP